MRTQRPKVKRPSEKSAFLKLQNHYNLCTPEQIKFRIIWNHLKMLTDVVIVNDPINTETIKQYEREWRLLELEENRRAFTEKMHLDS